MAEKCGIVMKGGITSGVVYPLAINKLAERYEYSHIGGTSAGAIAAGFVAAAEFRRQQERAAGGNEMAGFEALSDLADHLSNNLKQLFQPAKVHRKTFNLLMDLIEKQPKSAAGWVWKLFWKRGTIKKTLKHLDSTFYGLCPGLTTQDGHAGLSDFLHERLQGAAGLANDGKPLTIGDLKQHGIVLNTITTNISQRTPINLPNMQDAFLRIEDAEMLLPTAVLDYVKAQSTTEITGIEEPEKYLWMPTGDAMPVFLLMRLSLSFPVLLSAFPIYRVDHSKRHLLQPLQAEDKPVPVERCLLSDGGITSNFPIHLFDRTIPSGPVFGISLESFHDDRQNPDVPDLSNRAYLPSKPRQGQTVPIHEIGSLLGFAMQIFHSAQTWQDFNQTRLPGYRERVVRLFLKEDAEGGLNLDMNPEQIKKLTKIGEVGGDVLLNQFDMDAHRWRRLLSAYAAVEEALEKFSEDYNREDENVETFLGRVENELDFKVLGYRPASSEKLDELAQRLQAIDALAASMAPIQLRNNWGGTGRTTPKPSVSMKIVSSSFLESDE
ncbi:MAG: patatin-like phospholipase family protein [Pseudomonadota bacterium]